MFKTFMGRYHKTAILLLISVITYSACPIYRIILYGARSYFVYIYLPFTNPNTDNFIIYFVWFLWKKKCLFLWFGSKFATYTGLRVPAFFSNIKSWTKSLLVLSEDGRKYAKNMTFFRLIFGLVVLDLAKASIQVMWILDYLQNIKTIKDIFFHTSFFKRRGGGE